MKIKELLSEKQQEVVQIAPDAKVCECVEIMNECRIGAVMVVDGQVQGIISERDIMRKTPAAGGDLCAMAVSELMTPAASLVTISSSAEIDEAMQKMTANKVRHLPVMDEGALVGILSIGDVVKTLWQAAVAENKTMKQYMFGQEQILV